MREQVLRKIIFENVTKNSNEIDEICAFINNPRCAVDIETLTEHINYVTGMDRYDAAFIAATLLTKMK